MILVDYSQLCIASYMVAVGKHTNTDPEVDIIRHMVLNSIRSINSKFKSEFGELVLAVDTNHSWRKDVFPYYKANRKETRDSSDVNWAALYQAIETVRKELEEFSPYKVVKVDKAEADDIIGVLTRDAVSRDEPVLIVSGDKDFIQLQSVNGVVKQWDNAHTRWISHANPNKYLFEHVVKGDRGDGIPNALSPDDHYISPNGRAPAIRTKKLEAWWSGEEDIQPLTSSAWFKRNVTLIDLRRTPAELQQGILEKYQSQPNKNKSKLLSYFINNGLKQLTNSYGDF